MSVTLIHGVIAALTFLVWFLIFQLVRDNAVRHQRELSTSHDEMPK